MPDTRRSEVYLRLGSHSEKQYILKTLRLFSGVIAGSNLLESTPGATVSLALRISGDRGAFAIDPMTYTFGMDLRYIKSETIDRSAGRKGATRVGLKRSFLKLAKEYGDPVVHAVVNGDRSLEPGDFDDDHAAVSFCESVHAYQAERMRTHFNSDAQLREFARRCPDPSFVFAPYFYIPYRKRGWEGWLDLNLRLAEAFAAIRGRIEKHCPICIDQSVLDDRRGWLRICEAFLRAGTPAYWLWLSGLSEERISKPRAEALAESVELFAEAGRRLYNLHGGYLSALLSKRGLTGFSHGVGYGEGKDVVPVIGVVVPTVNYHYPPLHIRTSAIELERALPDLGVHDTDDFGGRVCSCTVCKGVLAGDLKNIREFGEFIIKAGNQRRSQTPDSAKKCRLHFLLARRKEIDQVSDLTVDQLKEVLRAAVRTHATLPGYLTLQTKWGHLRAWLAAL